MKKILLVEQDIFLQDMYTRMLSDTYEVFAVRSAQSCIDILDSQSIDLVICDMYLGANNGIEVLHELRSYHDWLHIQCIVMSIVPLANYPQNARWEQYGVAGFLYKPRMSQHEFLRSIAKALDKSNSRLGVYREAL